MELEDLIATTIAEQMQKFIKHMDHILDQKIKTLPIPSYEGVWDKDEDYKKHSMVTFRGSVWAAIDPSCGVRPATDEGAKVWKLAVKSGDRAGPFSLSLDNKSGMLSIVSESETIEIGSISEALRTVIKEELVPR